MLWPQLMKAFTFNSSQWTFLPPIHPIAFWPTKTQHLPPLWQCQHTLWGRMSFLIRAHQLIPLKSHPKRVNAWSLPTQFSCFTQDFTVPGDVLLVISFLGGDSWPFSRSTEPCLSQSRAQTQHCSRCPTHSNSGRTKLDMSEPKMNQAAGVRNTTLQAKVCWNSALDLTHSKSQA